MKWKVQWSCLNCFHALLWKQSLNSDIRGLRSFNRLYPTVDFWNFSYLVLKEGPSLSSSYGSWICNYLCNRCLSPLMSLVFYATFNNISVISWRSVVLEEETGGLAEKTTDLSQVTDKLYHIMLYTSSWSRLELTTFRVTRSSILFLVVCPSFSFSHCVDWPSSTYVFWLHLWLITPVVSSNFSYLVLKEGPSLSSSVEEGQSTQWLKEKEGQTTKNKIEDRVTRTSLKTGDELRSAGRVSSSCSTSGTCRITLVTDPMIPDIWDWLTVQKMS
jgi:hypothetical protein